MKNTLFEIATRRKYRFAFKGMISVEDLWDLSKEDLDVIYTKLSKEYHDKQNSFGLLDNCSREDHDLKNKIDIVKFIFEMKLVEEADRNEAAKKARKKQQILEILAKKQDDSLKNMSEEDLLKMLDELN